MKHRGVILMLVALVLIGGVAPGAWRFGIVAMGDDRAPQRAVPPPTVGNPTSPASEQTRKQVLDILGKTQYSRWNPQARDADDLKFSGAMSQRVLAFFKRCADGIAKMWDAISGPIRDFFQKIGDWLKKLWPSSPSTPPTNPNWNITPPKFDFGNILRIIGWVCLAGVVIALAVLLFKRVRIGPRQGRSARVLSREQVRSALESGEALALDGHEWVEQAEKLLAEKDLRAVYRALYLAMLAGLHSAGKIDYRQTRTNWFYVRRFKGEESERGVFGELTELFDEVWYGNRTGRIDEVSRVKAKVVSLVGAESIAPRDAKKGAGK